MAHVVFVCAGDGIEELGPVQAEHFRTSSAGQHDFNGPVAHDLSGDTTMFWQLCVFLIRGVQ